MLLLLLLPLGIVELIQPVLPEILRRDIHLGSAASKTITQSTWQINRPHVSVVCAAQSPV
jgi:hypothetical protein